MSKSGGRQKFSSKMGFILSAVGSAVGLGNIWRFPYVLYENGGGSFLIPYFIALFTAAIPLLIVEYTLGNKFRGSGPLAFARNNPKYEWIGWIPAILGFMVILYYSSIVSWAMNYLVLSFNLGWGSNPDNFYFNEFLKTSGNAFELGEINFKILAGLFVVWGGTYVICSRSISKGIEKLNKVLLPLLTISLLIVIFRGVTLEGAEAGLNVLFTPDFSQLAKPKVWLAAYSQVFFSLSVAMGIMITYTSYLPKDSDLVNTAYITGFANSAFEFTVSIGVFGILGYMATAQGLPVTEVVEDGVGLAFVVFPQAFTIMGNFGKVLGIVFFASLVFAGFTSFVSLTEAVIVPFIDKFKIKRKHMYRIVCGSGFVISTIFATGAGLYILDIVDYFINNFVIVTVGLLEAIVVSYVFGIKKFQDLANRDSIQEVKSLWKVSIMLIVPVVLIFNLLFTMIDIAINGYGGYTFDVLLVYGVGSVVAVFILTAVLTRLPWKHKEDITDFKL